MEGEFIKNTVIESGKSFMSIQNKEYGVENPIIKGLFYVYRDLR